MKIIQEFLQENSPPKEVVDNGFDFGWDEKKVWTLNYPTQKMKVDDLKWHFYIPFWGTKRDEDYNLKPIDVINNPKLSPDHYKRIMKSDLKHPIDLMKNKKGKLVILDGLHRLAKYYVKGITIANIRIIPRSEIPNIAEN
jgi:hypothetical protein